ncbi:MAG: sugar phosphate nucleotidyltransferase [Candidatus Methanodesulfokora sp.]
MKAGVLAAGKGKRLRPITLSRPKPLIPLAGTSLLDYHISALLKSGVTEISVLVGHLHELVEEHLCHRNGIRISKQKELMGTGDALLNLEDFLDGDFILTYADVYFQWDKLKELISAKERADHVVGVTRVKDPWNYGVVLQEDGYLKRIVEKPKKGEEPSNMVIAGIFLFSQTIFDHLKKINPSPRGEYELTDAITKAAMEGEKVALVDLGDRWTDIGRFEELFLAQKNLFYDILNGFTDPLPEGARVEGSLIIGGDFRIEEDAKVEGPAYIGKEALIRGSINRNVTLEEGNIIGKNSSVEDSILMKGASLGDNTVVKRSVLCDGSHVEGVELTPSEYGLIVSQNQVIRCACKINGWMIA